MTGTSATGTRTRKAAPKRSATRSRATDTGPRVPREAGRDGGAGWSVPGLPAVSLPTLPLPDVVRGMDTRRLLWLGGVGAMATIGILEWPIALVVGTGALMTDRLFSGRTAAGPSTGTTDDVATTP